MKRVTGTGFFVAALACLPLLAHGQAYPNKPIVLVVGAAPGGTTDITARALGDRMREVLAVPVVIENKPGWGSGIAAGMVARAKPDGYTLGLVSMGAIVIRPHVLKLPYDPLNDFAILAQYSRFGG